MNVKKTGWLYLAIILSVAVGTMLPAVAKADGAVAIWDLEDLTPLPSTTADMGEILSAKVIETFENSGNYKVVERQRLLLVLEELNLGTTELVSDSTRLEIGKLIGARIMVFGSYIIINDTMRMDLRKVEVETGLILKAISKTTASSDLIEWLKIAEEAAKELL